MNGDISRNESYVPFYRDQVLAWDVDPVGVRAVLVIAHPMPFDGSGVQLGSRVAVDPYALPPFGHAHHIRFLPIELLVRCDVAKCPR